MHAQARLHPMQDEQDKARDENVMDEDSSFAADDAVTNRSDDTALDEAQVVRSSRSDEIADLASDESNQFDEFPPANGESNEYAVDRFETKRQLTGNESDQLSDDADVDDEVVDESEESGEKADDTEESTGPGTRPVRPVMEVVPEDEEIRMDWYILKVQSNRERSIAEALERKIKIEGLDRYFDQVIVPTEKVTEFKGGKKKVVERKLYPGYIVVHMHINDDTWFAVRETSGVGDFTGAGGKPTPMLQHEVARIIQTEEEETSEAPKLDIKFSSGDKVKVKEGNFENFEGEVNTIDEASGRVTVMINIFGRSTPVELEYWQIEAV
jgi:transcriptional antiterminator NusG